MTQQKKEGIFKLFFNYVSLNILGMIGLSCYILADTFFISNGTNTNGLTALNLSIPIYSLIHATGLMIGMGGGTKHAIARAQGKSKESNYFFSHSILIGLVIGILFLIIGILFSDEISSFLGADESTMAMTQVYLKTLFCFAPFFIVNNILIGFIRNDDAPNLSMTGMLIGSFSNIILDYIFIFPLHLGMFGAAFATGLAPIISICVLSRHFYKKRNTFHFIKFKVKLCYIKDICLLGFSAFITEISAGIVIIVFNLVILRINGNVGVAAYGVIANLALVILSIFTGIAQGIQPIISKSHASHQTQDIKIILKYAISLALVVAALVYAFTQFYYGWLISLFNKEQNDLLAQIATEGIRLYFIGFFFAGTNIVSAAFFSAIESPVYSFIISICRGFLIMLPSVFILSNLFGITGVWISYPCAEILSLLLVLFLFRSYKRKEALHH